jgi:hypothetical protein
LLSRHSIGEKKMNNNSNHVNHVNIDAVTNHEDGECSFKLDTIPDKGIRTVDVFQGDERLFSISISDTGVCYQVLQAGRDRDLCTLWEDEV